MHDLGGIKDFQRGMWAQPMKWINFPICNLELYFFLKWICMRRCLWWRPPADSPFPPWLSHSSWLFSGTLSWGIKTPRESQGWFELSGPVEGKKKSICESRGFNFFVFNKLKRWLMELLARDRLEFLPSAHFPSASLFKKPSCPPPLFFSREPACLPTWRHFPVSFYNEGFLCG